MGTVAEAHPNIALIKYWGKRSGDGNYPAAPSLSITLDTLVTRTQVETRSGEDRVRLAGAVVADRKITACLADLRSRYAIPNLEVRTENNFPTAAGLASSASGFAALVAAVNAHCGLDLTLAQQSDQARRASGSAARSVFGGFVTLGPPDWTAEPLLAPGDWPLTVVIAVTADDPKPVPSSAGMLRSKDTSPYYAAWVESTHADFARMIELVRAKDFAAIATLAEFSCLKMHGLMLASQPGLVYWKPATVACLHAVRALRAEGVAVFFTVDAGPQVKAVCEPEAEPVVRAALASIPGVQRVLSAGLGPGVQVVAA